MVDSDEFDPQDEAAYCPTDEEIARIRASSLEERAEVQNMVLRECHQQWQKVAMIVARLLPEFGKKFPHLPVSFLQATMQKLEDLGEVEIDGDVWAMHFSEIRLMTSAQGDG